MAFRRITLADLAFGEPLPWDLFGPTEKDDAPTAPLLKKGQLLSPGPTIDTWLALGLYADAPTPPSVLRNLNHISRRLELALLDLRPHTGAEAHLRELARGLVAAVDLDADVALACIFLNQIGGPYAVRHCVETAVLACVILRAMKRPDNEIVTVVAATLTMNVSMVRQTEGFQHKHSALSGNERAAVHRHPVDSVDLLHGAGVIDQEWLNYVVMHHENDDGSGYPKGKRGDEIAQNAKLINLADRYCAQVSARNYRRSVLPDQALHHLFLEADVPADVTLARHFIEQIGKYPPGTLVRLHSGDIGVVARRLEGGALSVHVLLGEDGSILGDTEACVTSSDDGVAETLPEDSLGMRFSMKAIWGDAGAV